jgi:hypothetical protein
MVCAWCDTPMGGRGSLISHGICKRCFTDMFQPQFNFMRAVPALDGSATGLRRRSGRRGARHGDAQPELFSSYA